MGRLLLVLFLILLIFVGVGFYLEWFTLSLSGDNKGFHVNFFVDKDKLEHDEKKAKEKLEKVGEDIKEKTNK